jgi:hypothetical protein
VEALTEPGMLRFCGQWDLFAGPSYAAQYIIKPQCQHVFASDVYSRSFVVTFCDPTATNIGTSTIKVEVEREQGPIHSESLTGASHMINEQQDHCQTTIFNLDEHSILYVMVHGFVHADNIIF